MYNTILVPTDLSDEKITIRSLQKAKKLSNNDHIILLHVLDLIPSYALAEISSDLIDDVVPRAHGLMQKMSEKADVETKIEVKNGSSYRKIIESAEKNKVGLILISSHRPEFKDYLLGSTAAKVVRHAQCSVLVDR